MNVSLAEAIDIHARASRGRFGLEALQKSQEHMSMLAIDGDAEGVEVWRKVGARIEKLDHLEHDPARGRTRSGGNRG